MSPTKPSGIAASLGNIQHARKGPQAVTEYPDTRIPESARPDLALQGSAKRSHPDFAQLKAYVRKSTKRDAMRKAEDQGYEDFSELIQKLLTEYLNTRVPGGNDGR